jgi:hypothetical protein
MKPANFTPNVAITGTQFIAYPLSMFPGGADFLKEKTIEIEFDSLPTGVNMV